MRTCAVDFETGGLVAGFHPALSVAIVPLTDKFLPDKDKEPFITDIGVENMDRLHPRALKVNGFTEDRILAAPSRLETVKAFFEWARQDGKFAILGQNWAFDKGFFQHWIDPQYKAPEILDKYVHYQVRDLARVVMFACDRAKAHADPPPFKGVSLVKICERLGVVNPAPHTAYGDACAAAECYNKLIFS